MLNRLESDNTRERAILLDQEDSLCSTRERFHIPTQKNGNPYVYLCGNSLGLQPKQTETYIQQELKDWQNLGVEGHVHAKNPWMIYPEFLTEKMAKVVGAKPLEVTMMNTLSVNLHLLMVSFYQPTKERYKIAIESDAFPSDRYAVESQLRFHGYPHGLVELKPREGETLLRHEDIEQTIEEQGDNIALILMGCPNYYTGQVYNINRIVELGHMKRCKVGIDLAHGAGNLHLNLHDANVDFATWCTYKYLNSGPGSIGGCFIHERHARNFDLPRLAGWWGHNKTTRFGMRDAFDPIPGAEGWQLSNPPILSLAAIRASLDIFDEVGMPALVAKSRKLTGFLEELLKELGDKVTVITPQNPEERGCQLSIQVHGANGKDIFKMIREKGVIADQRKPNVMRITPVPLYNSFKDVSLFVKMLKEALAG